MWTSKQIRPGSLQFSQVPPGAVRCRQVRRKCGAELPGPDLLARAWEGVGGVSAPRPLAPVRPGTCGPVPANLSPRSPSRPHGGWWGRGGPGSSGAARVSPRQGPGSWWLRRRERRSGRRGLPAFQELAEPALHLLLRGPCEYRESRSAAVAPGPWSVPARRAPIRRYPSLCTCAALRDQLAGPLGDGVHGAEGPPRAPLERTLSPPRPPARGQVPRPLLKIALGVRRGRCRFNRQPNAAGKGRVRYTPPALKGPARLGMARRHAAGAVLQLLGSLILPCAARPGRTRWNQRSAPLAQGRGSVFRPGAHVRRAVVRPGELWDTQSIGEALAQGACRVSGDVPRSQHPCH